MPLVADTSIASSVLRALGVQTCDTRYTVSASPASLQAQRWVRVPKLEFSACTTRTCWKSVRTQQSEPWLICIGPTCASRSTMSASCHKLLYGRCCAMQLVSSLPFNSQTACGGKKAKLATSSVLHGSVHLGSIRIGIRENPRGRVVALESASCQVTEQLSARRRSWHRSQVRISPPTCNMEP